MRPYLLAAAVLACAALPASAAGPCAATADTPAQTGAMVFGSGSFTCATPSFGMTVTVCLESLRLGGTPGWQLDTCDTGTASGDNVTVSAGTWWCYFEGTALVRTVAFGSNSDGAFHYAASAPVLVPGVGSCGP